MKWLNFLKEKSGTPSSNNATQAEQPETSANAIAGNTATPPQQIAPYELEVPPLFRDAADLQKYADETLGPGAVWVNPNMPSLGGRGTIPVPKKGRNL